MDYKQFSTALMALCIWREARGEVAEAKAGVGYTILNRAVKGGWYGSSVPEVIYKPYQYSSFNANDPQLHKIPKDDVIATACFLVAEGIMNGTIVNPVGDAVSYFDKSLDGDPPKWATPEKFVCTIGNLHFYKE